MDNYSVYSPDVPASPLACANQYQFCNVDKDHCGPLASFSDAVVQAAPAFGTTTDMLVQTRLTKPVPGRFQRLAMTLRAFPIHFSTLYLGLGSESLLVKQTLNNLGVQGPLPGDQWQREMTAWWAATLAGLQTFFVQTASGVNFEGLEDYRDLEPVLPFEHDMCSNQASSSNSYQRKLVSIPRSFKLTRIFLVCRRSFLQLMALSPCLVSRSLTSLAQSS